MLIRLLIASMLAQPLIAVHCAEASTPLREAKAAAMSCCCAGICPCIERSPERSTPAPDPVARIDRSIAADLFLSRSPIGFVDHDADGASAPASFVPRVSYTAAERCAVLCVWLT